MQFMRKTSSFFVFFLLLAFMAFAKPTGMKQIHGNANIKEEGNVTNITTDQTKSILHWNDFSIGEKETTHFMQPTSSSSVLNRVVQENPSKILGNLESNGTVYLINPYGVIFGENAHINTAAFVASTFDVLNEDFLNKTEMLFKGDTSASIINYGTLETSIGDVTLIGRKIENHGNISAKNGEVHLAAGVEVLVKPEECQVLIKPCQDIEDKEDIGIDNKGNIEAIKASLQADGNLYELAINHSGHIDAFGVMEKDGEIFLIAEDGSSTIKGEMTATNANDTGGKVSIFAKDIVIEDTSTIDASGKNKGGEILIGGDYQGQTENYTNAQNVVIYPNAKILADAKENGDGGKVIVWAENACQYFGHISTRGGEFSGDGGFVEVSSHGPYYVFKGTADRLAPSGQAGILFLDPVDVAIGDFGGAGSSVPPVAANYPAVGTTTAASLDVVDLQTQLGLGPVTINTSTGGTEDGNISIEASLLMWNTNTLTLQADNNITFASAQTWTGSGPFNASANGDITIKEMFTKSIVNGSVTLSCTNFYTHKNALFQWGGNDDVIINPTNSATFHGGITWNSNMGVANSLTITVPTGDLTFNGEIKWNNDSTMQLYPGADTYFYGVTSFNTFGGSSGQLNVGALGTPTGGNVYVYTQMDFDNDAQIAIYAGDNDLHVGSKTSQVYSCINYNGDIGNIDIVCSNLYIYGGSSGACPSWIRQNGGDAALDLTVRGHIHIEAGSGSLASAFIQQDNVNTANNFTLNVGGSGNKNLYIYGGAGDQADAYIYFNQGGSGGGNLNINALNIELTGGSSNDTSAIAYIRSNVNGDMTIQTLNGSLQISGGTGSVAPAYILKDTGTGNLTIDANDCSLAGNNSVAYIKNISTSTTIVPSDLSITITDNMHVTGSTYSSSGNAFIQHSTDYGDCSVQLTSGDLLIQANAADAYIASLDDDNTDNLIVTADLGEIIIYGGTSSTAEGYIIKAGDSVSQNAAGGDLVITANTGITLQANEGPAFIQINSTPDAASPSNFSVEVAGGHLQVHGSTTTSSAGYIKNNATRGQLTVTTIAGGIILEANEGSAYINTINQSNLEDLIINSRDDIYLYGGTNTTAQAFIAKATDAFNFVGAGKLHVKSTDKNIFLKARKGAAFLFTNTEGAGDIEVESYADLQLLGGTQSPTNSQAYIKNKGGYGSITTSCASDGQLILSANNGKAYIESETIGYLKVSVARNDIQIMGGRQHGAEAYIRKYARDTDNHLTLQMGTSADLYIQGGYGAAFIENSPYSTYTGAANIKIDTNGGDLFVAGGDNRNLSTDCYGQILLHNLPGGVLELVNIGSLNVLGGSGQGNSYGNIIATGTTSPATISITASKDIYIQGGEGDNYSYAQIYNDTSGDINISSATLSLEGGSGAIVDVTDSSDGANANAAILCYNGGNITINCPGGIEMHGGTGGRATATASTTDCYGEASASARIATRLGGDINITSSDLKMVAGEGGIATAINSTASNFAQASGKANARISTLGGGDISLQLGGSLHIEGGSGGDVILKIDQPTATVTAYGYADAYIESDQGHIIVAAVNASIIGGSGGKEQIQAPSGGIIAPYPSSKAFVTAKDTASYISFDTTANIYIKGGSGHTSPAYISTEDGGFLACTALVGNIYLYGGTSDNEGQAAIHAQFRNSGTLTVSGLNIYLYAGNGQDVGDNTAFIQADNSTTTTNSTIISAFLGDIHLEGGQTALDRAYIANKNAGLHSLTLLANQDIYIGEKSFVENEATGKTLLATDTQFPSSPFYGNGKFTIKSTGKLLANGILQIFTSQRVLNVIETTINGSIFTASDVPDDQEQWPVWYPDSFWGGNSFVLFYKVANLLTGSSINYWINQFMIGLWNKPEMFVIRPYEKYIPVYRAFKFLHKKLKASSHPFSFNKKTKYTEEETKENFWMQKSWLEPSTPYNPTTMNHF